MNRLTFLLIAAGLFAAPAAMVAQSLGTRPDSGCTTRGGIVECRVIRLSRTGGDSAMMKRAALGVELRATGTRRDTLGVFIESVTPNGPAENSGIVEGDRIARINGVDVRSAAADIDDPYTNGLAGHRLSREVGKLTPGSRVILSVWSGGRYRDVQVTTGRASDLTRRRMMFQMHGPGMEDMQMMFGPHGDGPMHMPMEGRMIKRVRPVGPVSPVRPVVPIAPKPAAPPGSVHTTASPRMSPFVLIRVSS